MLRPDFHPEIPEETVKVARAAFPNGNMYLSLRDTLIHSPTYYEMWNGSIFSELRSLLAKPIPIPA